MIRCTNFRFQDSKDQWRNLIPSDWLQKRLLMQEQVDAYREANGFESEEEESAEESGWGGMVSITGFYCSIYPHLAEGSV